MWCFGGYSFDTGRFDQKASRLSRRACETRRVQDRPDAAELLAVIAQTLEREVMPALDGALEYRVRVAANLARIVERELRLAPELLARERSLLESIVGPGESVLELNTRLAARLRSGATDAGFERRAHALLAEVARGKLSIARPGYESYDSAVDA